MSNFLVNKLISALVLALVMFMAPMATTASAEPAPVDYSVQTCGLISWSYSPHAKYDLRQEWLESISRVSSLTGITFVETTPDKSNITVGWKGMGKNVAGYTDIYMMNVDKQSVIFFSDMFLSNTFPRYVKNHWPAGRFSGRVKSIMIHELGHALGLGHSVSSFEVMSEDMTFAPARLTRNDIRAFKSVNKVCVPV